MDQLFTMTLSMLFIKNMYDLIRNTHSATLTLPTLIVPPHKDHRRAFFKHRHYFYALSTTPLFFLISAAVSLQNDLWLKSDLFTYLAELDTVSNLKHNLLIILALSSLTVYSIILAGWASNSKYAFMGALRSAAQMISYEVAITLVLLPVVLLSGSLNLARIVFSQFVSIWFLPPLFPVSAVFLVAMLAETNRTPFDLPEAEAELVAGYNVDFSSLPFAMFFLGEYSNMILMGVLFCILFLSGWFLVHSSSSYTLSTKASLLWIFFVLVRATLPRYRYDQLMEIGWKAFLPVTSGFLLGVIGLVVFFSAHPVVEEISLLVTFGLITSRRPCQLPQLHFFSGPFLSSLPPHAMGPV